MAKKKNAEVKETKATPAGKPAAAKATTKAAAGKPAAKPAVPPPDSELMTCVANLLESTCDYDFNNEEVIVNAACYDTLQALYKTRTGKMLGISREDAEVESRSSVIDELNEDDDDDGFDDDDDDFGSDDDNDDGIDDDDEDEPMAYGSPGDF